MRERKRKRKRERGRKGETDREREHQSGPRSVPRTITDSANCIMGQIKVRGSEANTREIPKRNGTLRKYIFEK